MNTKRVVKLANILITEKRFSPLKLVTKDTMPSIQDSLKDFTA